MGKTIDSGMLKAEIKMLIVLDVMIWFFIVTSLYISVSILLVVASTTALYSRVARFESL